MTPNEINQSIEAMKVHLTQSEKLNLWSNFIFLLIPISILEYATIDTAIKNKEFSFFSLIPLGLFALLLRHKLISPKLKVYKLNLTEEQFKKANRAAAKLNDWTILSNKNNYFSAIKKTNLQRDGIKITVILNNEKLYLNSMENPTTSSNPFTFGLNKKNKLELISQYQSILEGNDVNKIANKKIAKREAEFWNESEWTFKNTIKRIIGYGLSILFMALAIWITSEGKIQGLICGITILGICGNYIFYDIKVILEKNKKNKARL